MIYIVDEIMGRGKTTAMLRYVNEHPENRYLFITPYLTEVTRVKEACKSLDFVEPYKLNQYGSKLKTVKMFLEEGKNIVTTHALFLLLDDKAKEIIREKGYTLIMDESATVADVIKITPKDAKMLFDKFVAVDGDGKLRWLDHTYEGKFEEYKRIIETRQGVYFYSKIRWIHFMSPEIFDMFTNIYILTYLFDGQPLKSYFEFYNVKYSHKYIGGDSYDTYHLSDTRHPLPPIPYKSLIDIVDSRVSNKIGEDYHSLSKEWYKRNSNNLDELRKRTTAFFRSYAKTPSEFNLWTTFKGEGEKESAWKKSLSVGGQYAKGFTACTIKGTNAYRHKTSLAYLINLFPGVEIYNFLKKRGIEYDSNVYSLYELVQWIWRSAIRDGKPIKLYIPSRRMRTLLTDWLDKLEKGG